MRSPTQSSRRDFMCLSGMAAGLALSSTGSAIGQPAPARDPNAVLARLVEGNKRFVKGELTHPGRRPEDFVPLAEGQAPLAVIVGCADSRVSPELIFDQGVGDLFVVRVAGSVIGPLELASIDYSMIYLGSVIIIVLGHENCGAVDAVVRGNTQDIEAVADIIRPAVKEARATSPENLLEMSVKTNARRMKELLLDSPVIKQRVAEGKVEVHAAYYHLKTGVVELLKSPVVSGTHRK